MSATRFEEAVDEYAHACFQMARHNEDPRNEEPGDVEGTEAALKVAHADAIKEAVERERERCALIALDTRAVPEIANNQFFRERAEIAKRIREGK